MSESPPIPAPRKHKIKAQEETKTFEGSSNNFDNAYDNNYDSSSFEGDDNGDKPNSWHDQNNYLMPNSKPVIEDVIDSDVINSRRYINPFISAQIKVSIIILLRKFSL